MIVFDGRDDKQDIIQPLVLVTSPLIHIVLLLMLAEVSIMPLGKSFGFSLGMGTASVTRVILYPATNVVLKSSPHRRHKP